MKKMMQALVVSGLLLMMMPAAHAVEGDSIHLVINGETFVSPAGEPAPYANKDQRTLIPIRFFAEKLGVPNDEEHIVWDQETLTATITDGTNTVVIPLGSREIEVNGETVVMDTVAESKDGRVFIPARFLAEGLGAKVYWDQEDQVAVFMTEEYVENHPAMQTDNTWDIDDPYIGFPFYDKHTSRKDMQEYGSAENFVKRMKEFRAIVSNIKAVKDVENEQFIVTLPEYDRSQFTMTLTPVNMREQKRDPGTYYIPFKDVSEIGYIYNVRISDYKVGAYIHFTQYGYLKDGEYYIKEGTVADQELYGVI